MAMLGVCVVQVRAQVVGVCGGGGRRHQGRVHALRQGPSAVIVRALGPRVRHHDPQPVLVAQGHALQEVVEQLRGHRRVDARAAGHEGVHVVHTLDVAGGEALAGLPVHGVRFYREEETTVSLTELLTVADLCALIG